MFTGLNLRGVQTSSRVNALLALGMSIVVVVFIAEAIRYIAKWRGPWVVNGFCHFTILQPSLPAEYFTGHPLPC